MACRNGITPIESFDASLFNCRMAGEIKHFDPTRFIEKKELKKMGRFIQIGIAAADDAIKGSGLTIAPKRMPNASAFTSAAASADSKSSNASTGICSNTGRAVSRRSSFRRRSSISRPATFRFAPARKGRIPRPPLPVPRARIRSAIRSKSFSAAMPMR